MKLIDQFLPDYHYNKVHQIHIDAPSGIVYQAVQNLDLGKSALIRWLFRLRGMPESAFTLEGMEKLRFSILGKKPGNELVIGLIGKFWTLSGNMQKINTEAFTSFQKPGFSKAAWNFYMVETAEGETVLSTETRIYCTDPKSKRKFHFYWFFIGSFSGWIRKRTLTIVKEDAESVGRDTGSLNK